MTDIPIVTNPAEEASRIALEAIFNCIQDRRSFVFEAGAGAGKTYSLIKALKYLIQNLGNDLLMNHQQIACITYTNVATNEILSRIDSHPVIFSSTIHAFCWAAIQDYQAYLREELASLDSWSERIALAPFGIQRQKVIYDLGFPAIDADTITLGHNDVITLIAKLMRHERFRKIFSQRYPVLFIDEYQDTDKVFIDAIKTYILDLNERPFIGFFGDHWQKIYPTGCGNIEHPSLEIIGKRANFRSVSTIVDMLNLMRPELTQEVEKPESIGHISIFHTNSWQGTRRTGGAWSGDLPSLVARNHLIRLKEHLADNEWDLSPDKTKILMLTHKVLAEEQGYMNLASVFERNEEFIKKENKHIAYFLDVIEPICNAFENRKYGEMFSLLGKGNVAINTHEDKINWSRDMSDLIRLRHEGTIGDVINCLRRTRRPRLSQKLEEMELELETLIDPIDQSNLHKSMQRLIGMKGIRYNEVIVLAKFLSEKTLFATKHGVKGAEFENVIIVVGRGWSLYDFNKMLEWFLDRGAIPQDKIDSFERNRNLFYVACSRPKKRLSILFTQKLSDDALATLRIWCGEGSVNDIAFN